MCEVLGLEATPIPLYTGKATGCMWDAHVCSGTICIGINFLRTELFSIADFVDCLFTDDHVTITIISVVIK